MFKKKTLRHVPIENLLRLAKYLKLRTDGMSKDQIISLIRWRLHPNRKWGM